MNAKKLWKPVKSVVLNDCAFHIEEEADGLTIYVTPIEKDAKGNVRLRKITGVCNPIIDIWGNLIGCKDVGACNKSCKTCPVYDDDGNETGDESCSCINKCPE